MDIWIYLLKVSALWLVFYLCYNLLLKRETFFQANRWFLLSGLVLAPILPLITFTKTIWRESALATTSKNLVYNSKERLAEVSEGVVTASTGIDWMQILFVVYAVGVGILLLRLFWRGFTLARMLRNSDYTVIDKFRLIDDEEIAAPFSFFRYIAYNSEAYSKMELENIIKHEKVHSQQKHSIDVLVGEVVSVIFWFHPVVWLYKKAVLQNLEFLADTTAIEAAKDKKHYQMTLLKVTLYSQNLALTNAFYQPLIKKRIQMLNKDKSKPARLWKIGIVVPLLFIFVIQFQTKVVAKTLPITTSSVTENELGERLITFHEVQKDTILKTETKKEDLKITKQGVVSSSVEVSWDASLDKFANKTLSRKELRDFVESEMEIAVLGNNPYMVVNGKQSVKDTDKITLGKDISVLLLTGQKAYDRYGEVATDGVIIIFSLSESLEESDLEKPQELGQQRIIEEQEKDVATMFEEMEKANAEVFKTHDAMMNQLMRSFNEVPADTIKTLDKMDGIAISIIEIQINKDTTEEQIADLKSTLEADGITMKTSRIKRNGEGEIYQIHIKLMEVIESGTNKSSSEIEVSLQRNKSNPIPTITVGKQNGRLFID